jgi:broad specificity phosphatase PhoE
LGRLILIRHCETGSNASGIVQGRTDLPLSPRGVRQAALLGAHLKQNYAVDRVITSDRSRCVETARAFTDSPNETPLLRELDFGDWEGQKWSNIIVESPEEIRRLLAPDPEFAPPGGETIASMNSRIKQAIYEFDLRNSSQTTTVVGHDGILRSLTTSILGWPTANKECMTLFVGSVSEISILDGVPRLDLLNQYDHMTPSYETGSQD